MRPNVREQLANSERSLKTQIVRHRMSVFSIGRTRALLICSVPREDSEVEIEGKSSIVITQVEQRSDFFGATLTLPIAHAFLDKRWFSALPLRPSNFCYESVCIMVEVWRLLRLDSWCRGLSGCRAGDGVGI